MDRIAAFDIGSTHFRYGLGTPDGEILAGVFEQRTDPSVLLDQVVNKVAYLQDVIDDDLDAVCVSSTGLVDSTDGVIEHFDSAPGYDDLTDVHLKDRVQEYYSLPVYVENDANAAALGEYSFGADVDHNCVVHVSIGTGIGAGIVEDGRIFQGEIGQAGEVGMIPVSDDDTLEASGVPGTWEAHSSIRGINQYVQSRLENETRETAVKQLPNTEPKYLFETARSGDPVAQEYVAEIGEYNARGIYTLTNIANPGLISLGGRVVLDNPDMVLEPIHESLETQVFVSKPDIRITSLGEEVGILGALSLYRYYQ